MSETTPAMVRFASADDIEPILNVLAEAHRESRYRNRSLEPSKLQALLRWLIDHSDGACIVAEEDGEVAGVVLGLVVEFFFSRELVATEILHYLRPAYRGSSAEKELAQWFIAWSQEKGVVEIQAGGWVGAPHLEAEDFYSGLGFTSSCRFFAKQISHVLN